MPRDVSKFGSAMAKKRKKQSSQQLKVPVEFYQFIPKTGFEPGKKEEKILHSCLADIYSTTMKELEKIASLGKGEKRNVSLRIRDSLGEYDPKITHGVRIYDRRMVNTTWKIISVEPDLENNDFIKIIASEEVR